MAITSQNQASFSMSPGMGYRSNSTNWFDPVENSVSQNNQGAAGGNARVNEARAKMYALAQQRLNDVSNDPVDSLLRTKLMSRVNGDGLPYDATTKNALFTQQAEQLASAEGAQMRGIPGNPTDPSYQAMARELQSRRQGGMQAARRDIDTKANVANYNAQTEAMNGLNSWNTGLQSRITGASGYLGGLYSREEATSGTGGSGSGANFSQMILPGGGNSGAQLPSIAGDPFFAPAPPTGGIVYGSPSRANVPTTRPNNNPGQSQAPNRQSIVDSLFGAVRSAFG
jgi:hypothetical protein